MIIVEKLFTKYQHMIHRISLKQLILLSGFLMMFFIVSCDLSKQYDNPEETEQINIQKFLSANDTVNFEKKTSGLYYYEILPGTGPQVETHDTAYVFFGMFYLSGILFDTNVGTKDTMIFVVNEGKYIPGFEEGISYMKEKGKSLFLVPSSLAYGATGTYYISPYTPFLFQVELVKLKKH